jgi:Zn-dependent protease with chaperone function
MFCYQCGGEMPEGAAFCHRCGAAQSSDAAAAAARTFAGPGAPAPAHLNIAPIGDYLLSPDEYISPHDRSAMQTLQATGELNRLVQTFVGKFGKPWLEAGFLGNGLKIGPEQFPMLHRHASELAEVFCLTRLPDIYAVNLYYTPLAIARSTRSATIGTDTESFIVLDARLLGRLADPKLTIEQLRRDPISFLLAGELAHVALGHALWLGIAMWISLKGPSGIAGLVSRPLIMPLIYWARQAVLSADRGVVLATGLDREFRDYLLAGLVAVPRLVPMVNVDAYLRQIEGRNESVGRFLEGFSSTQPYISRRLAALDEFEREPSSPFLRRKVAAFLESQGRS